MLKTVIEAKLPIVAVSTRDTINLSDVLFNITGHKPVTFVPGSSKLLPDTLYLIIMSPDTKILLGGHYMQLAKLESTLLVVNPPRMEDAFFDAGEVPIPKNMLFDMMQTITEDATLAKNLVRALGGVTLKESAELAKLNMARDQSLTAGGIVSIRNEYFQAQSGLFLVDPAQPFYMPDDVLEKWVVKQKQFFLNSDDPRLMPRGLLLDGPPGVGKTSGAKYLAEQWGVPLYRVDVGATKNKYVGESENNMLANLNRLDREEPCIALFDEIEKVFAGNESGDSNTTNTMMSQVLWWLAEHKSRVLVIMTTNKIKRLPPELYRDGRIDDVMVFKGLDEEQSHVFVQTIANTFDVQLTAKHLGAAVKAGFSGEQSSGVPLASHAALTQAVYEQVKHIKLDKGQKPLIKQIH